MINVNRRDFVKLASLLPLQSAALFVTDQAAANGYGAVDELWQVVKVWFAEMEQSPSKYLESHGVDITNSSQVKQCLVADFEAGDVIAINGLVLSQTEAAILAEFALTVLV